MAASHDQSSRKSSTASTATQNNIAASEGSQTNAQVTTGSRNQIGNTTTDFGNNATVNIESLDPETIAGAFGLTKDVVENLTKLSTTQSQASEANTAAVANAFEHFGSELSTVTQRQVDAFTPDGGKDKIILAAIAVGGLLGVAALLRKKRP